MINEQKVKMMTKLAIYEKNIGKEDLNVNEYYKHDYILLNNIRTRIAVTIASTIIFGGHALAQLLSYVEDKEDVNFLALGIAYSIIYIFLMIFYSFISTRIYAVKYKHAQARLAGYKKYLEKIQKD
ncbi:MAG: hypothetical protein ACLFMO_00740 [Eubacteriales bacterium]